MLVRPVLDVARQGARARVVPRASARPWPLTRARRSLRRARARAQALEQIGNNLQAQYERWQSRARYRQLLDPTADELRRMCLSLRRSARGDRLLLHYNGHGVPRPTANGEIWVFNQNFTQYIPLSVYDLQCWLSTPCILVLDCSNAG